jgi:Fe2+ or Zn2+ uptake regulation protein
LSIVRIIINIMRPKLYDEEIIKICKCKHYSVKKILSLLQEKFSEASQATVYRTLRSLAEEGSIKKIKGIDDEAYYETNIGDHGHAIDQKTGKIHDFELPKNIFKKVKFPKNFSAEFSDIKFYGNME